MDSKVATTTSIGRGGKPAEFYDSYLYGLSGQARDVWLNPTGDGGTAKVRVPRGGYTLNSGVYINPEDYTKGGPSGPRRPPARLCCRSPRSASRPM
ncbi:hypothetical protein [Streptomyces sp. BE133]|uniref:hypothetical protein n=1 Tax=Streptomyces sp. BE133 TaxID=3002523 RepID=UPI002E7A930E|nr:hypothetical protein [Streptomyces sp. BE133]MEE1809699.1 hypothetical protein [Streptomyces sp. BE133]